MISLTRKIQLRGFSSGAVSHRGACFFIRLVNACLSRFHSSIVSLSNSFGIDQKLDFAGGMK